MSLFLRRLYVSKLPLKGKANIFLKKTLKNNSTNYSQSLKEDKCQIKWRLASLKSLKRERTLELIQPWKEIRHRRVQFVFLFKGPSFTSWLWGHNRRNYFGRGEGGSTHLKGIDFFSRVTKYLLLVTFKNSSQFWERIYIYITPSSGNEKNVYSIPYFDYPH